MVTPERILANSQGSPIERLGIPEATLILISPRETVDRLYDIGMVGTKLFLADGNDLSRERDGFRIFARSKKSIRGFPCGERSRIILLCNCRSPRVLLRSNRRGEANTKLRIAPAMRALRPADFILPSPVCGQEFVLIQHRCLDKEPSGEHSGAPEGPDQGPRLHRAAGLTAITAGWPMASTRRRRRSARRDSGSLDPPSAPAESRPRGSTRGR
jgi:hypothetical protein